MMPTSLRAFALVTLVASAACSDDGAASVEQASWTLTQIRPLIERDVKQVKDGLPQGADLLSRHLADDPGADPAELQRRIKAARENVQDLAFSKGTFFSFTTPDGTVLRSESDPDRLVEKNVLGPFPALKKALDPGAGVVFTSGEMEETRGVRTGPDLTWVAAHAVPAKEGAAPRGLFVTGWSFRAYAFYLEEAARRALSDEARKQEKNRTPVAYAYLARSGKVYGAPVSPDINAEALAKADVSAKAKDGPWRGTIPIDGRIFGVAAERVPELGEDTTLAVIATVY